jgi:hypothetical protein
MSSAVFIQTFTIRKSDYQLGCVAGPGVGWSGDCPGGGIVGCNIPDGPGVTCAGDTMSWQVVWAQTPGVPASARLLSTTAAAAAPKNILPERDFEEQ